MNYHGVHVLILLSAISSSILGLRHHILKKAGSPLHLGSDKFDGYALLFDCDGVIVETEVNLMILYCLINCCNY
jgi:hypothetical protein